MIRNLTILLLLSLSFGQFQPQNKAELQEAVDLWVFDNLTALSTYGEINIWDVSLITDMSYMFSLSSFNSDISSWDVSNVTDMSYMFVEATGFNQDISGWNVFSVTNMVGMFYNAGSFNSDISGWNVSSVTNMVCMFYSSEMYPDPSFNSDISSWDVSNVTDMSYMFQGADSFNQDISSWDVSSVTNMSYMFEGADALSDGNKCAIHTSFSSNDAWTYVWDQFCVWCCMGCTYNTATNYNLDAIFDDGSCEFMWGDMNHDGELSVLDVMTLVNAILTGDWF